MKIYATNIFLLSLMACVTVSNMQAMASHSSSNNAQSSFKNKYIIGAAAIACGASALWFARNYMSQHKMKSHKPHNTVWNDENKARFKALKSIPLEGFPDEKILLIDDESSLDASANIDLFTSYSFKELIEEKIDNQQSYILARVVTQDNAGKKFVHYYDAHSLNTKIFKSYPIEFNQAYLGQDIIDFPPVERNTRDQYVYDPSSTGLERNERRMQNMGNRYPLEFDSISYFILTADEPVRFAYLTSFKDLLKGSKAQEMQRLFFANSDTSPILCHTLQHDDAVLSAAVTPDGKWVITGSSDKTIKVWDILSGKLVHRMSLNDEIIRIKITPNGKYLVIAAGTQIILWDLPSCKFKGSLDFSDCIKDIAVSNQCVVGLARDNQSMIYNINAKRIYHFSHKLKICSVEIGNESMIYGTEAKTIIKLDYQDLHETHFRNDIIDSPIHAVKAAFDGIILGFGNNVFASGTNVFITYNRHVYSLDVFSDNKYIVAASGNNAYVHDITAETDQQKQENDHCLLEQLAEARERVIASRQQQEEERRSTLRAGFFVGNIEPNQQDHMMQALEVEMEQQRQQLINEAQWRVRSIFQHNQLEKRLKFMVQHKDTINIVKISPDQKYIITGSKDKTAKVWNSQTGELKSVLPHAGEVTDIAVSNDSKRVVTVSTDKSAKVWLL